MINPSEFLPGPDDIEETESEPVQGFTKAQANRRCKDVAKQYNGRNPRVRHKGQAWWDCEFEVWRTLE